MLRDELLCSYKSASEKISGEGVCDNRSIDYCDKSGNTHETPLRENQFTESNLVNDYIDVYTILKEINDSLTRNDDIPEVVNFIFGENSVYNMMKLGQIITAPSPIITPTMHA